MRRVRAPVTFALIAANLAVFLWMLSQSPAAQQSLDFTQSFLIAHGGLTAPLVRAGEWWRLLSAPWLHGSVLHIIGNMVALFAAGTELEWRYGARRFLVVYLVAGLGGSLLSLANLWSQPTVAVGASGAIMGVVGAGVVAGQRLGPSGVLLRNGMLRWALAVLVFGAFQPNVDTAAHLGGLASGVAASGFLWVGGARAMDPLPAPVTTRYCPWCGGSRSDAATPFCRWCGNAFTATGRCPTCHSQNPLGSRYCGQCGAGLSRTRTDGDREVLS